MSSSDAPRHLTAERIQALLEGELAPGELAAAEAHRSACARCASEVEAWRALLTELDTLADAPVPAPSVDFAERVITGLEVAVQGARHPATEILEDYLERLLPAREAARIRAHVTVCASCRRRIAAEERLTAALSALPELAPSEGFAARVMAGVRIGRPVPTPRPAPAWSRALAWVRNALPQTREAWAAVAGMSLAPLTTAGIALYTVFSHPTLTLGGLMSFLWWQAGDVLARAGAAGMAVVSESVPAFQAFTLAQSLVHAPLAVFGGLLAFTALLAASAWILVTNLRTTSTMDRTHVHASI